MIRRDIYIPEFKCSCQIGDLDSREKVYLNDNFKFLYTIYDSETGGLADLSKYDFSFRFYTFGNPGEYWVTKIGTHLINCIVDFDKSIIKAIIENTKLIPGKLMVDITVYNKDTDFADDTASNTKRIDTNVTLLEL